MNLCTAAFQGRFHRHLHPLEAGGQRADQGRRQRRCGDGTQADARRQWQGLRCTDPAAGSAPGRCWAGSLRTDLLRLLRIEFQNFKQLLVLAAEMVKVIRCERPRLERFRAHLGVDLVAAGDGALKAEGILRRAQPPPVVEPLTEELRVRTRSHAGQARRGRHRKARTSAR